MAEVIIQQLEKYNKKLVQVFETYQVEENKKWLKYLVSKVSRQIMMLNSLANIISKIAKEAFEIFCNININWSNE